MPRKHDIRLAAVHMCTKHSERPIFGILLKIVLHASSSAAEVNAIYVHIPLI